MTGLVGKRRATCSSRKSRWPDVSNRTCGTPAHCAGGFFRVALTVMKNKRLIAFQGEEGAYSDLAARTIFPNRTTLSCPTFEHVFAAVRSGKAEFGIIPIDNAIAGRVADIHHLLPNSKVHIVGEHFQPIEHRLLGTSGATLSSVREVHSHVHALAQCRSYLQKHGYRAVVESDTAGSAKMVQKQDKKSIAAIASPLAAKLYDLKVLAKNIEDKEQNVTRFIIVAKKARVPRKETGPVMTSIYFSLRSVPSALFKAIGGFATTNVNLTKLESYVGDHFQTADFYVEAEAHPEETRMQHALAELAYFTNELRILGVYPADSYRYQKHTEGSKTTKSKRV